MEFAKTKFIKTCTFLLIYALVLYLVWLIPNEFTKLEYNTIFEVRDAQSITFYTSEGDMTKQFNSQAIYDYFIDFRLLSSTKTFRKLSNQHNYQVVITSKQGYKINGTLLVFKKQNGEEMTILQIPTKYLFMKKNLYGSLPNEVSELPNSAPRVASKRLLVNLPYSLRTSISLAINPQWIATEYGEPTEKLKFGNRLYESRNISDGSKLIVVYEDRRMIDMWQLKKLFDRSEFNTLKVGESTLEDVLSIDSYTTLLDNDSQGTSAHRLEDGTCSIRYSKSDNDDAASNDWIVQTIEFDENDDSGFTTNVTVKKLLDGN